MAGIYARTDATRGVHKAPANESMRGALGLTYRVTREEQGELNQSGVNCIRFFPRGHARVGRADARRRQQRVALPQRAPAVQHDGGIDRASTRWVVFEPNDVSLWKSISRDVSAFLTLLWREGALMGRPRRGVLRAVR